MLFRLCMLLLQKPMPLHRRLMRLCLLHTPLRLRHTKRLRRRCLPVCPRMRLRCFELLLIMDCKAHHPGMAFPAKGFVTLVPAASGVPAPAPPAEMPPAEMPPAVQPPAATPSVEGSAPEAPAIQPPAETPSVVATTTTSDTASNSNAASTTAAAETTTTAVGDPAATNATPPLPESPDAVLGEGQEPPATTNAPELVAPEQPAIDLDGLDLSSQLDLGNLMPQGAALRARATAAV
jgi:hypothetical protein